MTPVSIFRYQILIFFFFLSLLFFPLCFIIFLLSICLNNRTIWILYLHFLHRRCLNHSILFLTYDSSWCQRLSTDTFLYSCCNASDYCNVDLHSNFPGSPGGSLYQRVCCVSVCLYFSV